MEKAKGDRLLTTILDVRQRHCSRNSVAFKWHAGAEICPGIIESPVKTEITEVGKINEDKSSPK